MKKDKRFKLIIILLLIILFFSFKLIIKDLKNQNINESKNEEIYNNSGKTSSLKYHKNPLFTLAVEFEGHAPADQIVFYEYDDPVEVAEQFCLKNNLQYVENLYLYNLKRNHFLYY